MRRWERLTSFYLTTWNASYVSLLQKEVARKVILAAAWKKQLKRG
jgi:hypothetical protein